MKTHLLLIAALVTSVPSIAQAKKKPWDLARYRACVTAMPYDALDVSRGVTSAGCRKSTQVTEQRLFNGTSLSADPLILSAKPTNGNEWIHSLILNVTYERINNVFYKGGFSPARLSSVVFLLGDKQVQREIDLGKSEYIGCDTYGRGTLESTTCPFRERVGFQLFPNEIDAITNASSLDPLAKFAMRVTGESGEKFDVYIDAAEVVATVEATTQIK